MSDALLAGRFRKLDLLGAGAMGRVFRALDSTSEREVALKVMDEGIAADPALRWRFKQEFWLMSRAGHPVLVPAYDLGQDEHGVPFFTMELVVGNPVTAPDPADAAALDGVVIGLLSALSYLHGLGYIHGDLKPDNCRIGAGGQVRLLDYGLADPIGTVRGQIRGTLEYLAPEGFSGRPIDGRLDLYALGCAIYQLIAGRPPFEAANPWTLMQAHQAGRPAFLADLGTPLGRRWASIVMRLVAKDPRDRFASASAVLEALGADPGDLSGRLLESPLVGGAATVVDRILAVLTGDPRGGAGRAVAVTGAPGTGKSRVVEELRARLQVADRAVLVGGRGTGVPYGPFRPVVEQARDLVMRAAPERLADLDAPLAPLLEKAPLGVAARESAGGKVRLHGAIAALLAVAAAAKPGLTVILDGWETADSASRDLLGDLLRGPVGLPVAWLLGGTSGLPEAADLSCLPALTADETREVVAELVGAADLPAGLAVAVHEAAQGNPRLVTLLVTGLVDRGLLRRRQAAWGLARPLEPGDLRPDVLALVRGRLGNLGGDAATLAGCAAVYGHIFRPEILAAALGWDEGRVAMALDDLQRSRLVRPTGDRFALEAAGLDHELAAALPGPLLAKLPAALTTALNGLPAPLTPEDEEALWELACRTGRAREALRAGLASGRRHLSLFAAGRALERFEALGPWLGVAEPGERFSALRGLGDALRLAGRSAEAATLYREALDLADDPDLRASLLVSLGKAQMVAAKYDFALAALDEAAALARSAGQHGVLARALAARGRIYFFKADRASALQEARDAVMAAQQAGDAEQEAVGLTFLGMLLGQLGPDSRAEGHRMLGEAIAIAQRAGDQYSLNLAYSYLGNAHLAEGDLKAAGVAFAQNRRICRAIGARDEEMIAALNLAVVALDAGEPVEAEHLALEAGAWADEAGRQYPLAMARAIEGAAAVEQGRADEGLEALAAGLRTARDMGNAYLEGEILPLVIQADLRLGREAEAGISLDALEALASDAQVDRLALLRGSWLTAQGRYGEARKRLATATASDNREIARRAAVLAAQEFTSVPIAGGFASPGPWDFAVKQPATLADAPSTARFLTDFAVAVTGVYDDAQLLNHLLDAAIEIAGAERCLLLLYVDGQLCSRLTRPVDDSGVDWSFSTTIAKRALWSGEPLFVRDALADGTLAAARSVAGLQLRTVVCVPIVDGERTLGVLYLDRRTVDERFGRADLEALVALASIATQALVAARRVVDLERTVVVDRELARLAATLRLAPDPATAGRLALESCLRLVPAERALLVVATSEDHLAIRAALGADGAPVPTRIEDISQSIARWVIDSGEPVAILDALGDESWKQQKSVPALALRAVIGVPVRAGGLTAGALYLDTRDPVVQFGPEDLVVLARCAELIETPEKPIG